jgi:hypothetical protein
MRRFITAAGGVLCGVLVGAQTPASDGPTLAPIWDLKGDFAAPESAYYHAGSNSTNPRPGRQRLHLASLA